MRRSAESRNLGQLHGGVMADRIAPESPRRRPDGAGTGSLPGTNLNRTAHGRGDPRHGDWAARRRIWSKEEGMSTDQSGTAEASGAAPIRILVIADTRLYGEGLAEVLGR